MPPFQSVGRDIGLEGQEGGEAGVVVVALPTCSHSVLFPIVYLRQIYPAPLPFNSHPCYFYCLAFEHACAGLVILVYCAHYLLLLLPLVTVVVDIVIAFYLPHYLLGLPSWLNSDTTFPLPIPPLYPPFIGNLP